MAGKNDSLTKRNVSLALGKALIEQNLSLDELGNLVDSKEARTQLLDKLFPQIQSTLEQNGIPQTFIEANRIHFERYFTRKSKELISRELTADTVIQYVPIEDILNATLRTYDNTNGHYNRERAIANALDLVRNAAPLDSRELGKLTKQLEIRIAQAVDERKKLGPFQSHLHPSLEEIPIVNLIIPGRIQEREGLVGDFDRLTPEERVAIPIYAKKERVDDAIPYEQAGRELFAGSYSRTSKGDPETKSASSGRSMTPVPTGDAVDQMTDVQVISEVNRLSTLLSGPLDISAKEQAEREMVALARHHTPVLLNLLEPRSFIVLVQNDNRLVPRLNPIQDTILDALVRSSREGNDISDAVDLFEKRLSSRRREARDQAVWAFRKFVEGGVDISTRIPVLGSLTLVPSSNSAVWRDEILRIHAQRQGVAAQATPPQAQSDSKFGGPAFEDAVNEDPASLREPAPKPRAPTEADRTRAEIANEINLLVNRVIDGSLTREERNPSKTRLAQIVSENPGEVNSILESGTTENKLSVAIALTTAVSRVDIATHVIPLGRCIDNPEVETAVKVHAAHALVRYAKERDGNLSSVLSILERVQGEVVNGDLSRSLTTAIEAEKARQARVGVPVVEPEPTVRLTRRVGSEEPTVRVPSPDSIIIRNREDRIQFAIDDRNPSTERYNAVKELDYDPPAWEEIAKNQNTLWSTVELCIDLLVMNNCVDELIRVSRYADANATREKAQDSLVNAPRALKEVLQDLDRTNGDLSHILSLLTDQDRTELAESDRYTPEIRLAALDAIQNLEFVENILLNRTNDLIVTTGALDIRQQALERLEGNAESLTRVNNVMEARARIRTGDQFPDTMSSSVSISLRQATQLHEDTTQESPVLELSTVRVTQEFAVVPAPESEPLTVPTIFSGEANVRPSHRKHLTEGQVLFTAPPQEQAAPVDQLPVVQAEPKPGPVRRNTWDDIPVAGTVHIKEWLMDPNEYVFNAVMSEDYPPKTRLAEVEKLTPDYCEKVARGCKVQAVASAALKRIDEKERLQSVANDSNALEVVRTTAQHRLDVRDYQTRFEGQQGKKVAIAQEAAQPQTAEPEAQEPIVTQPLAEPAQPDSAPLPVEVVGPVVPVNIQPGQTMEEFLASTRRGVRQEAEPEGEAELPVIDQADVSTLVEQATIQEVAQTPVSEVVQPQVQEASAQPAKLAEQGVFYPVLVQPRDDTEPVQSNVVPVPDHVAQFNPPWVGAIARTEEPASTASRLFARPPRSPLRIALGERNPISPLAERLAALDELTEEQLQVAATPRFFQGPYRLDTEAVAFAAVEKMKDPARLRKVEQTAPFESVKDAAGKRAVVVEAENEKTRKQNMQRMKRNVGGLGLVTAALAIAGLGIYFSTLLTPPKIIAPIERPSIVQVAQVQSQEAESPFVVQVEEQKVVSPDVKVAAPIALASSVQDVQTRLHLQAPSPEPPVQPEVPSQPEVPTEQVQNEFVSSNAGTIQLGQPEVAIGPVTGSVGTLPSPDVSQTSHSIVSTTAGTITVGVPVEEPVPEPEEPTAQAQPEPVPEQTVAQESTPEPSIDQTPVQPEEPVAPVQEVSPEQPQPESVQESQTNDLGQTVKSAFGSKDYDSLDSTLKFKPSEGHKGKWIGWSDRGGDQSVSTVQHILIQLGYSIEITGKYDRTTFNAVQDLQQNIIDSGIRLRYDRDGLFGQETWKALKPYLEQGGKTSSLKAFYSDFLKSFGQQEKRRLSERGAAHAKILLRG